MSRVSRALARGTLPPEAPPDPDGRPPARACDLSITCPSCSIEMQPEHAHYRCPRCGYRDSCCF